MKQIFLALTLVASSAVCAFAEGNDDTLNNQTVLKGTVTDLQEYKPLPNVEVSLVSMDDKFKKSTETDNEGKFVLQDFPAGTYKVCYEKRGFENGVCQSITVLDGQTKNIGLTMFGR